MFTLSNDQLEVSLLDPILDRERLGTRYCSGGYIFQISDANAGELLSGPSYPDSFDPFDGQGIPDAFSRSPLRDPDGPHRALVIGVGLVDVDHDRLIAPCQWDVDVQKSHFTFMTRHSFAGFAYEMRREVSLAERTVRTKTRLRNVGALSFPISWFPHPFFPHPARDELCWMNVPVHLQQNDGYEMAESGFIRRKGWPWDTDHFLVLDHEATVPVTVLQRHPKLSLIAGSFSYVPGYFPIWGNHNTFSFEPYLERFIGAGQTLDWWVAWHL